jgi:endonuclease/exonuclease/phosphatase family metal-dependent hydrolase
MLGLSLSAPAGATTRPPAPTSLTVVTTAAANYLTWQETQSGVAYSVQQATDLAFTQHVKSYLLSGPGRTLTPYGLSRGTAYYFRVRAVVPGAVSAYSNKVSFTASNDRSLVKVMTYNTMSATFDGQQHAGGVAAAFSLRRDPQLALMLGSHPDVIGIQEGSACLKKIDHKPCWRQIDSLAYGLAPTYKLVDTYTSSAGVNRYYGNYILHDSNVATVGSGGTWLIGPSSNQHKAAYQEFRVVSTGAKFLFVNTHLITGTGSTGDSQRGAETQSMLNQAKSYANQVGVTSIVYVGDFNSYVGQWHVNDISGRNMRVAHVPDAIEVATTHVRSKYDSINALYRTPRQGHGSIDHIFASGGIGVKTWGELLHLRDGQYAGTIPSDHNPVYAVITVPF